MRSAPTALESLSGLFLSRFTDLDGIRHGDRPELRGQARGHAFMLYHVGLAFQGGHAALHVQLEFVGSDFRFRQPGANFFFDFRDFAGAAPVFARAGLVFDGAPEGSRTAGRAAVAGVPAAARSARIAAIERRLRILS